MRLGRTILPVLIVGTAFSATASRAADNLDCVSTGYTAEIAAEIDSFQGIFNAGNGWGPELPQSVFGAVTGRAGQCAEQHGWSPEAIEDAVFFQMFSILRGGVARGTPLSSTQMQRVDQALAGPDQERLRAIVGRQVDSVLGGAEAPEPTEAENMFIGRLILRAGVPVTEENGHYVGAYMASVVMPQVIAARFADR